MLFDDHILETLYVTFIFRTVTLFSPLQVIIFDFDKFFFLVPDAK